MKTRKFVVKYDAQNVKVFVNDSDEPSLICENNEVKGEQLLKLFVFEEETKYELVPFQAVEDPNAKTNEAAAEAFHEFLKDIVDQINPRLEENGREAKGL